MKFGRTLRDRTLKEWRFYTVDYKALKKSLKLPAGKELVDSLESGNESDGNMQSTPGMDTSEFFRLLDDSEQKLTKFYHDKERWAFDYMKTLEDRVTALREVAADPEEAIVSSPTSETSGISSSSSSSNVSDIFDNSEEEGSPESEDAVVDLEKTLAKLSTSKDNEWLKDAYRRMGESKHFHKYIYAKKSLMTFYRELELLLDFLELNKTAFSKILKKFDKKTGSSVREEHLKRLSETHKYLEGAVLRELKAEVASLVEEVNSLKPALPKGWENRKVYTIGCFDLFHRGESNATGQYSSF
jgi:SPX domain protein involved in polyphosphate accumulation